MSWVGLSQYKGELTLGNSIKLSYACFNILERSDIFVWQNIYLLDLTLYLSYAQYYKNTNISISKVDIKEC